LARQGTLPLCYLRNCCPATRGQAKAARPPEKPVTYPATWFREQDRQKAMHQEGEWWHAPAGMQNRHPGLPCVFLRE